MSEHEKVRVTTHVVAPLSLTDLAKSLREFVGLLNDVLELIERVSGLGERRVAENVAAQLQILRFAPHGSRSVLEKIASGQATDLDYDYLSRHLDFTERDVGSSVKFLGNKREFLAKHFGMGALEKFDQLIYGPAGKMAIREELHVLAHRRAIDQDAVITLIARIQELNTLLVGLHDEMIATSKPR